MNVRRILAPRWLSSSAIPVGVLLIALLTVGLYAYGIGLLLADEDAFHVWIREDGLVEWLTFAALIASFGAAVAIRAGYERTTDNRAARAVWLVGVPIIQNYQLAVYLIVVLTAALFLEVHKVVELVEFASCCVVLTMIVHPLNADAIPPVGIPWRRTPSSWR